MGAAAVPARAVRLRSKPPHAPPLPAPHTLQAASWALSALQLRSGFPPRADFDGGGRQRFLFFAKADAAHMVGFYVFQVRRAACWHAGACLQCNLCTHPGAPRPPFPYTFHP